MDKILETKKCKQCSMSFDITQNDRDFYDKISPIFDGEKFTSHCSSDSERVTGTFMTEIVS